MKTIPRIAKAFASAAVTGLSAMEFATVDNHLTLHEAVIVGIATLVAFNAVYWVPNTPA